MKNSPPFAATRESLRAATKSPPQTKVNESFLKIILMYGRGGNFNFQGHKTISNKMARFFFFPQFLYIN